MICDIILTQTPTQQPSDLHATTQWNFACKVTSHEQLPCIHHGGRTKIHIKQLSENVINPNNADINWASAAAYSYTNNIFPDIIQ